MSTPELWLTVGDADKYGMPTTLFQERPVITNRIGERDFRLMSSINGILLQGHIRG
jgi:hypothetical protein